MNRTTLLCNYAYLRICIDAEKRFSLLGCSKLTCLYMIKVLIIYGMFQTKKTQNCISPKQKYYLQTLQVYILMEKSLASSERIDFWGKGR